MKINVQPLLRFMTERHQIYLRRQAKGAAPPFTKDPILTKYKFTNVYRELDRVTVWVDKSIRQPYRDHPHLWFMLCLARQIGWPPTLRELMLDKSTWPNRTGWDWEATMNALRKRAARGEKVYTGAYMLNAHGEQRPEIEGYGRFDKPLFTCRLVLHDLWQERNLVEPMMHVSLEKVTEILQGYFGWGGFMSYEVACDLRHTRYLAKAPDVRTWAHAGPGALRGLRRVTGVPPRKGDALALMVEIYQRILPDWPYKPRLELREIEHSLCEFDKYERVRLGEGKPRALFIPSIGDFDEHYH